MSPQQPPEAARKQPKRLTFPRVAVSMALVGGSILAMACSAAPPAEGESTGETGSDLSIVYNPLPFAGCKGLQPLPTAPTNHQWVLGASCPAFPPTTMTNCWAYSVAGYAAHFTPTSSVWTCPDVRLSNGTLWHGQWWNGASPIQENPQGDSEVPLASSGSGAFDCLYFFDTLPNKAQIDASPFCSTNATALGYVIGPPESYYAHSSSGGGHPSCEICNFY